MSEKSKLVRELQDKASRDAFVSSQMSIPLAFQILALREQRGLTQKQLAEKAGMLQPRIAAMERPSGSEPNLRTLKRLASAFDVALVVRFVPFSELVEWVGSFSPDTFVVPSFDEDLGMAEVAANLDTDTTQRNPFQAATGLLTELKANLHQDAIPLIFPKQGDKKVAGGIRYDGAEKAA